MWKDLGGKGISKLTIRMPTAGNRGSRLPDLQEMSREAPRNFLLLEGAEVGATHLSTRSLSPLMDGYPWALHPALLHRFGRFWQHPKGPQGKKYKTPDTLLRRAAVSKSESLLSGGPQG